MAGVAPYVPSLYLPGNLGRYRSYPRNVTAVIPGTGYRVKQLVWGKQELDLDNRSGRRRTYGRYDRVPLRGVGQAEDRPAAPIALYMGVALGTIALAWLLTPKALRPNRRRSRRRHRRSR